MQSGQKLIINTNGQTQNIFIISTERRAGKTRTCGVHVRRSVYLQLSIHRIHFALPQRIEVADERQPQLEELVGRALVQRARLWDVLEIDERIVEYLLARHQTVDMRIYSGHSDANEFGRFRLEWFEIRCS